MSTTRSHVTRLLHLSLLLVVLHQLLSSTVMERPMPGDDPAWPYAMHEWVGVAGLGVLALFWLWTLVRHPLETPLAKLLPWFSPSRVAAVFEDVARLVRALFSFRMPPLELDALASAVHGLGLLVASFLALSGAAWFYLFAGTPYGRIVMGMHKLSANLMWAYLIGHASIALIHHALGDDIFSRMFWVKRRQTHATVPAE
ncbi:MAG: cytochrome b/b6 domain-containing protein [Roseiarcus sp.]|jgi:cytochrome b561